jgi:hypothetical protein
MSFLLIQFFCLVLRRTQPDDAIENGGVQLTNSHVAKLGRISGPFIRSICKRRYNVAHVVDALVLSGYKPVSRHLPKQKLIILFQ